MKRSNRLILLIGVLLAAVAFVGVIMITGPGGPSSGPTPTPPPTTAKVVKAAVDIAAGTKITAEMVTLETVEIAAAQPNSIQDTGLAIGKTVRRDVSQGQQVTFDSFIEVNTTDVTSSLAQGLRAMAVEVDQVSGVGTLIKTGDHVDVIVGFEIQLVIPDPVIKGQFVHAGDAAGSVKMLLQNIQVLGTLLPTPTTTNAAAGQPTPSPSAGSAPQQPATSLNGQQQIVILAVTANQAEVIRYAQLAKEILASRDPTTDRIALVLRSPKDYVDASGNPIVPPIEKTDGIILNTLVDKYGVLPPNLLLR